MAARECGDCYYYQKCDSEDCPVDKPAHGFCYVSPPMMVRRMSLDQDAVDGHSDYVEIESHGIAEVWANRPGCRYWEQ